MARPVEIPKGLKLTAPGFLDEFTQRHTQRGNHPFCWILGAGASVRSGIQSGAALASIWLEEIHKRECDNGMSLEDWATEDTLEIEGFSYSDYATFYPEIYARRFRHDRDLGYAYLENEMREAAPSLGYYILAHIVDLYQHKIVVTTNFDNLVADALSIVSRTLPLICGHESLAGYARVNLRRPLVAKIHGDLLLDPRNEPDQVSLLATGWQTALSAIFVHYTPIVIGYGGNDGSLIGFLEALPCIPGGIFWTYRGERALSRRIIRLVQRHHGRIVPIEGFDELLFEIYRRLHELDAAPDSLPRTMKLRSRTRIAEFDKQWRVFAERSASLTSSTDGGLSSDLSENSGDAALPEEAAEPSNIPTRAAADAEVKDVAFSGTAEGSIGDQPVTEPSAAEWSFAAAVETSPQAKEKIYLEGIAHHPNNPQLLGDYAKFLAGIKGDFDKAEEYFQKSLAADPGSPVALGNYATFLTRIRKQYDRAEELYLEALRVDPDRPVTLSNYGNFLLQIRKDYENAEECYLRALSIRPDSPAVIGNYAELLRIQKRDHELTELYILRAIELDSSNAMNFGRYAAFLTVTKGEHDEAEEMFARALEMQPRDVTTLGNYAVFLNLVRGDADRAEEYFKQAIREGPTAQIAENYAEFLEKKRGDLKAARHFYSLAADIGDEENRVAYEAFLGRAKVKARSSKSKHISQGAQPQTQARGARNSAKRK